MARPAGFLLGGVATGTDHMYQPPFRDRDTGFAFMSPADIWLSPPFLLLIVGMIVLASAVPKSQRRAYGLAW